MKQSLGALISETRKQLGMTQLELAEKLGVTDKAVSKWERNLACPDVNLFPALADALGLSLEELMLGKPGTHPVQTRSIPLIRTVLGAVALAMGVAVAVLSLLGELSPREGTAMLGLGLACLALLTMDRE